MEAVVSADCFARAVYVLQGLQAHTAAFISFMFIVALIMRPKTESSISHLSFATDLMIPGCPLNAPLMITAGTFGLILSFFRCLFRGMKGISSGVSVILIKV